MRSLYGFILCIFSCFMFSQNLYGVAESPEQIRFNEAIESLNWTKGPVTVNVGSNAAFFVPEGYVFLDAAGTYKMMQLMQNPCHTDSYYFGPNTLRWFGLFTYQDTGHISDDEKIDADVVFESLKKGTEIANKERVANGWSPLNIMGWLYRPFYDPQSKRLDWAVNAQDANGQVVNYNTRLLSRTGVTSATLVADPADMNTVIPEFKSVLNGYEFLQGEKYAEYKSGDKTAEYGLMALIAGGATAVAAKKGLFAVIGGAIAAFWKLILGGIVAILAGIGGIFRKKE